MTIVRAAIMGRTARHVFAPAVAVLAWLSWGHAATAQDPSSGNAGDGYGFLPLELSVRLQTDLDYRVRGVSRSDNDVSAGGTARVMAANGLYAQAGLRAVDLAAGQADTQATVRAGYLVDSQTSPVDLYAAYTFYPGAPHGADLDHWEVGADWQVDLGPALATGQIAYSPDYIGSIDESLYLNVGVLLPIYREEGGNGVSASLMGDVGYSFLGGAEDYADWSLGATVGLSPFDLTVEYVGTDRDAGQASDDDVLVSLGARLALN